MASGAGVSDECIQKYQELKLGHALKYIIFKLSDDFSQVIVEKTAPANASYDEFKAGLPSNDCRYAVFDFEFTAKEGGQRNKIVFILWAPDSAKVKAKMLYTSTKADFRKKLVGIATEVQATDASEIAYEAILEKAARDTK